MYLTKHHVMKTYWGSDQLQAPAALPPGKEPRLINSLTHILVVHCHVKENRHIWQNCKIHKNSRSKSILKPSYKDTPSYTFTEFWPDQSYAMEVKHEQ